MVKGNWERRAELAAIRRLEEKQRKEISKNDTNYLSIESVITKIMNDKLLLSNDSSSLLVWMEFEHSTSSSCIDYCSSWYRIEKCLNKKCKLSHDYTLATYIHNMIYKNDNEFHNRKSSNESHNYITKADDSSTNNISNNNNNIKISSLPSLSSPSSLLVEHECISKLIIDVNTKEMNKIRFISLHYTCIYDYLFPEVWKNWYNERKLYLQQIQAKNSTITSSISSTTITTTSSMTIAPIIIIDSGLHQLSTIHEINHEKDVQDNYDDDDDDDHGHDDNDNKVYNVKNDNDINKTEYNIVDSIFQLTLNKCISNLEYLIEQQNNYKLTLISSLPLSSFSNIYDMTTNITIYLTNQEFIYFFNLNKNIQKYCIKNDIIRQRKKEIYTIFINFYNKQKKMEQKKKIKQSHVKKTNKKDAFARGGNAH